MTSNHKIKQYSEIKFIEFINTKSRLNTNDLNALNRKRIIQMLDLFNSKYDCKICCKKLRYKADQIIHSELKHNYSNTTIKCPLCDYTSNTYFRLKFHLMKKHLNEKPYGCRQCNGRFYSFSLLKKHCYLKHLNRSSLSSSSSSSSSFASNSSESNNFIDLINYENSTINLKDTNLLQNSVQNPLSFNSELNMKYFLNLNKMKKSKNIDTLIAYVNETKEKQTNEDTFTIIVQLNVINCNLCSTLSYSNTDYLNHIWSTHLNSEETNQICWPCALKNNQMDKFTFSDKQKFEQHSKNCNQKWFKCADCCKEFSDLTTIKRHILNDHYKCKKKSTDSKTYLEEMLDLATYFDDEKAIDVDKKCSFVFSCFKCEQTYQSYESITKHLEKKCNKNSNRIKCSKCNLTLPNDKQFNIHLKQHDFIASKSNNIKNSKNNKSYSIDAIVNSINNRNKTVNRIDDIASKIISKRTTQESSLFNSTTNSLLPLFSFNQHKSEQKNFKSTSINQPIMNRKSSFTFSQDENINQYNNYLNKMIKNNDSLNYSSIKKPSALYASSNSTFSTYNCFTPHNIQSNINQILNINNSSPILPLEKKFKLNNSDMFVAESNIKLIKQELVSSKKMSDQFKCEYCGYSFSNLSDLNLHKLLHQALNPKRPFKCHLCQVTFAKTDQLTRHMIVHQANEMDSVCQVCYSSFSRKQDLDRHMLFHSK